MSWFRPMIGELSERLTLLEPVSTDDGMGGQVPATPIEAAIVWAQVDPRSGQEVLTGNELVATMPIRFRIHYRTDITESWLLEWRGRRLQITAPPTPEGQSLRQWLVLSALEGGPA